MLCLQHRLYKKKWTWQGSHALKHTLLKCLFHCKSDVWQVFIMFILKDVPDVEALQLSNKYHLAYTCC